METIVADVLVRFRNSNRTGTNGYLSDMQEERKARLRESGPFWPKVVSSRLFLAIQYIMVVPESLPSHFPYRDRLKGGS